MQLLRGVDDLGDRQHPNSLTEGTMENLLVGLVYLSAILLVIALDVLVVCVAIQMVLIIRKGD